MKALPLGPDTPFETGELREPWMKRVIAAISQPTTDERQREVFEENEKAEKQRNDIQKMIEKRRASGTPFNV